MTALQAWAARASDLLRRFGRFWLAEFLALFPERAAHWLRGRGRSSLVLVPRPDPPAQAGEGREGAIVLELLSDGRRLLASQRIERQNYSPAAIDRFLQAHRLAREEVAIGVRLSADKFFRRTLTLPVEAARSLPRIVAQDLANRTPFRPGDIYNDYAATRAAGADKLVVRQWVARRDIVEEAVAALKLDIAQVAFVEADGAPGAAPPLIALRPDRAQRGRWLRRTAAALACSAVLLALAGGTLKYWRQQVVLDDLAAQIASVRAKAQQVRAAIDKLEHRQAILLRLRSHKADVPGLIDVWEEATRVLPSHSWLTELRLAETADRREQQVSMTGFSAAAPSLVGLIDRSPFFIDASLTAPIALDPVEQRERFALQAKIGRREPIKRASR